MQWIKGIGLFGASFGVVFCVACFANAEGSVPAESTFNQALETAKSFGAVAFVHTERFRLAATAYLEVKLSGAEAEREAKLGAVPEEEEEEEEDPDKIVVAEPKPLMQQLKDSIGLIEGFKVQAYKALLFVFNSVYVFYGVLAILAVWIVRKIFRGSRGY